MDTFHLLIADELIFSRKEKLQKVAQDFIALANCGYDINSDEVQNAIFDYNDLNTLSHTEKEYIRKTVEGK